jgi:hypothetical protein
VRVVLQTIQQDAPHLSVRTRSALADVVNCLEHKPDGQLVEVVLEEIAEILENSRYFVVRRDRRDVLTLMGEKIASWYHWAKTLDPAICR